MHSFLVLIIFYKFAPAICAPFSFLLEINVLGCAFCSLPSHAPSPSPAFQALQNFRGAGRGEDGTGTSALRSPAQPARAPQCPELWLWPLRRLWTAKEQGSDHMTCPPPPFFLPPSRFSLLPPSSLPLPLARQCGAPSSGGCWCPAPGSGWQPVLSARNWYRWGLMLLFNEFPYSASTRFPSFGARFKSPVGSFADL